MLYYIASGRRKYKQTIIYSPVVAYVHLRYEQINSRVHVISYHKVNASNVIK